MKQECILIKDSEIQGSGVFSEKDFKKDDKIFLFSNNIIEIKHDKGCDCDVCKRCIQIGEFIWLYPEKNSFGWNLNHNCEPSCYIGQDNYIRALRDLKKDEEITIDYSTTTCDKDWFMVCECSSGNCRKTIKSIQYQTSDFLGKFKEKMPKFIEKINQLN